MSERTKESILVVDDERSMREFLEIFLTREGYQVTLAKSGEEACQLLTKKQFDLLITDIKMKDTDGKGSEPGINRHYDFRIRDSRDSRRSDERGGLRLYPQTIQSQGNEKDCQECPSFKDFGPDRRKGGSFTDPISL